MQKCFLVVFCSALLGWFILGQHPNAGKNEKQDMLRSTVPSRADKIVDPISSVLSEQHGSQSQKLTETEEHSVAEHAENHSIYPDPFPALQTLTRMAKRMFPHSKSKKEAERSIALYFSLNPKERMNLIDLEPSATTYTFNRSLTDQMREANVRDGTSEFYFQNQTVLRGLNDSSIVKNLPICVVKIVKGKSRNSMYPEELILWFDRIEHPVNRENNFRGVRIENSVSQGFDIDVSHVDCGLISTAPDEANRYTDTVEDDDQYKKIQFMHILTTISFQEYWRSD